ncbi:transposase, partial [Glycomyces tarimensis]
MTDSERQRTHGSLEDVSTQAIKERPLPRFEHRTGLDLEQLLYLEQDVAQRIASLAAANRAPQGLDLFDAIIATLIYLRHNTIQASIGEHARVSQATISRYIETLEPVVACCLDGLALERQSRAARGDLVIDGFLFPTRDLTTPAGLFSGKHDTPGMNAQVICDRHGHIIDAGALLPGSTHDARAFRESGLAKTYEQHLTGAGPSLIGDCGYVGVVPLTPHKKPEYRELTIAERLFNRQ